MHAIHFLVDQGAMCVTGEDVGIGVKPEKTNRRPRLCFRTSHLLPGLLSMDASISSIMTQSSLPSDLVDLTGQITLLNKSDSPSNGGGYADVFQGIWRSESSCETKVFFTLSYSSSTYNCNAVGCYQSPSSVYHRRYQEEGKDFEGLVPYYYNHVDLKYLIIISPCFRVCVGKFKSGESAHTKISCLFVV
jgi:hypothetical protein